MYFAAFLLMHYHFFLFFKVAFLNADSHFVRHVAGNIILSISQFLIKHVCVWPSCLRLLMLICVHTWVWGQYSLIFFFDFFKNFLAIYFLPGMFMGRVASVDLVYFGRCLVCNFFLSRVISSSIYSCTWQLDAPWANFRRYHQRSKFKVCKVSCTA